MELCVTRSGVWFFQCLENLKPLQTNGICVVVGGGQNLGPVSAWLGVRGSYSGRLEHIKTICVWNIINGRHHSSSSGTYEKKAGGKVLPHLPHSHPHVRDMKAAASLNGTIIGQWGGGNEARLASPIM